MSPSSTARRTSSSAVVRTCRRCKWSRRCAPIPLCWRQRWWGWPTSVGARSHAPSSCCDPVPPQSSRGSSSSSCGAGWPTSKRPSGSTSSTTCPKEGPARCSSRCSVVAERWTHTGYPQRIHFGPGTLDTAADVVKEVGGRRVMLVTTRGRLASDDGERLVRRLGRQLASTFDGVESHVPTTAVQAAVRQAMADDVDLLVSFGGGSCADLGKAVCFFVEQQAGTPGASYADRPALPHVSIPTTYSGAELTAVFGMTDMATHRKTGAGSPTVAPRAAIYDPLVTLDTPPRVSAETGMNALAHGIECAYSPKRTPEAEAIALACIAGVAVHLPAVVDDPIDVEARTGMLAAAALGGRCLQNAGMGVHHGLAQLVGGRTGIAHGVANAVILPHAMRFNGDAVPAELARIGQALGAREDPAGAVEQLLVRLELPTRLSDCGFGDDDLEAVARLSQSSPAVQMNPKPVSEDDARAILEAA